MVKTLTRTRNSLALVLDRSILEATGIDADTKLEVSTDEDVNVWEAPALNGLDRSYSGKEAVAKNYRELWASMRDVTFAFLQRFATADRVVDDSLVTFVVIRDGHWHFPVGSRIEMRLVHIFDMRKGKISRELVFDMGRPV
jgi:ketosteroid isomerase-like protein